MDDSELRSLRRGLDELRGEVARLASVQSQQSRQVSVLEASNAQADQLSSSLEERVMALEQERAAQARATRQALDSLGARVTELGVEVNSLPTAVESKESLQLLEQSIAASEQRFQRSLDGHSERLEQSLEALRKDLSSYQAEGLSCRQDLQGCRQDILGLLRNIWGESPPLALPAEQQPTPRSEAWFSAGIHLPLAGRMAHTEAQLVNFGRHVQSKLESATNKLDSKADLEDIVHRLSSKADVIHTHDRLTSADGTASFVL
mmetsp:Transcript_60922/g.108199  ORF Transcript_60922/g.108199 Transcript_60922/m.108199 type:complete len:262 (-) Transcript_60922:45-830(-)|eukprot:CAMPEP_0197661506 /NCGR_PEP_ID=MMETSP1338-20131121/51496_1 /TAXON_ID=43686 ORGANISM="Pelagodinium beii, Strain RCC1491" /NCGR_SAMPLE_ID=MMETSP1338 /ASSEMBLY_ACC=CAM_ASM_000754 /LENGTH=261 /DNA_ID=CAMNT_0043239071 /DNA_START=20 /DNA_END=805 /DNA_ORIENTATION=-